MISTAPTYSIAMKPFANGKHKDVALWTTLVGDDCW